MRIRLFTHSLWSDWNHGNAHFLRGVAWELARRGHDVRVYEPEGGWSLSHLLQEAEGESALAGFEAAYPGLSSTLYTVSERFVDGALEDADLVIVHEWSDPQLVRLIGLHRARHRYVLLFHDTHHRVVTQPQEMRRYDLAHYDGVLAFGEILRRMYLEGGFAQRAFTWHEAADTRLFCPREDGAREGLVWIGNWGDDERTRELMEFLVEPVRALGLRATVHGVRYPEEALATLREAGMEYAGFLPNPRVPEVFADHAVTVHVPRRPYVEAMIGIPTIRVFEALACGIPLVSAPWQDVEGLFRAGEDFLMVHSGAEMEATLRTLMHEPELRQALARQGLSTIRARHTCAHRVDELLAIYASLRGVAAPQVEASVSTPEGRAGSVRGRSASARGQLEAREPASGEATALLREVWEDDSQEV